MLRKIRSLVSNSDYFGIYDNALSKKECEILIEQFEKSPQTPGQIYNREENEVTICQEYKKSLDLEGGRFSNGSIISNIVNLQLIKCIEKYKIEHPQVMHTSSMWSFCDDYSFQKYDGEEDGYKEWHCEHGVSSYCNKRILVWMFYLNNAKSGTEFMNYPTVRAKMGRCVMWPAGWTHIHKGVTPNQGIKYIITGWISYCTN
jgi:hypothetical protein